MKYLTLILLGFFLNTNSNAQSKIICTGDDWKYYDLDSLPKKGWQKELGLMDGWKIGPSPLGYGDSVVRTVINYGEDERNKHITKYFRKEVRIQNPFEFLLYEIHLKMDDGAVVYLNGKEIARKNMPDGIVTDSTKASGLIVEGKTEAIYHKILLYPEDFNPGLNIIAATVHQGRKTSVDCIFDLELIGNNDPNILPSLLKERTLKNIGLDIKIKELEAKLSLEKKDLKIELLQKEKMTYRYGFLTAIFILIILTLTFSYILIRLRKHNNIIKKKVKNLKKINFNKNQELMSYSLHSIQNQQFLKETKHNLEESINEDIPNLKKEIKNLIRQIGYNIEQDDDWLKLLNHFNSIHTGYLEKLTKKHPVLSETELRHCIFIKLYMQTKEIAKILHIDPRSVQAARYRIKKKMNLEESIDLRNYLQEF
ncbi:helix-turn-helix transcriptional regulator [Winogradskyella sp.]|uniref:helix-turn-helix transcriptional regulator n=1 Tax=Winogradskyella sp. TaxID=1883156 RepID=UPI003BAAFF58